MKTYFTCDIGPHVIRCGIIDEKAVLTETEEFPLPQKGSDIPGFLCGYVNGLKARHDISGVCISTIGLVNPENGVVFYAPPALKGYAGCEWKRVMQKACGLNAEAESRVNCMGLAESGSGAAYGASSCLCMLIGTHVGACFTVNGKIFRGHSFSAAQVEYLPMYGSTFGELVSTDALKRKVAAIKGIMNLDWDSTRIFDEARGGDAACVSAVEEFCDITGRGIATVCYILNPETVVIGGSVMSAHRYLIPRIRAAMEKYLIDPLSTGAFIASASHGYEACMIGAYMNYVSVPGRTESERE